MKLVVGLGNPGTAYEETRHNIGFWFLDAFARNHRIFFRGKKGGSIIGRGHCSSPSGKIDFILAKPQTYMNCSGRAVRSLLTYNHISVSDLILVFDDLDLDCGRIRIRRKGRPGGHRGVASVIESVGTDQFARIKIGIGRDPQEAVVDYVLSPFREDEKKSVLKAIEKGVALLPLLLEGQVTEAMNLCSKSV
ncbi:MAG: aminoacyl-tRNA hydrolase [Nitrospiria bacterium]